MLASTMLPDDAAWPLLFAAHRFEMLAVVAALDRGADVPASSARFCGVDVSPRRWRLR